MTRQAEYSPCASCHQRCCHEYVVTVTGYDAWLLATRLQMAMEQFLMYFPTDADKSDGFRLDRSGTSFDIALLKREDSAEASACVFWLPLPHGYGRCGVYALRPLVCQNYPTHLSRGIVQLRTDVLCPAGGWNLSTMNLPAWRYRLLRYQVESDIYRHVVERWNRHVDAVPTGVSFPVSVYYAYLTSVYTRLDMLRQRFSADQERSILRQWEDWIEQWDSPLIGDRVVDEPGADPGWVEFVSGVRTTIDGALGRDELTAHRAAVGA